MRRQAGIGLFDFARSVEGWPAVEKRSPSTDAQRIAVQEKRSYIRHMQGTTDRKIWVEDFKRTIFIDGSPFPFAPLVQLRGDAFIHGAFLQQPLEKPFAFGHVSHRAAKILWTSHDTARPFQGTRGKGQIQLTTKRIRLAMGATTRTRPTVFLLTATLLRPIFSPLDAILSTISRASAYKRSKLEVDVVPG